MSEESYVLQLSPTPPETPTGNTNESYINLESKPRGPKDYWFLTSLKHSRDISVFKCGLELLEMDKAEILHALTDARSKELEECLSEVQRLILKGEALLKVANEKYEQAKEEYRSLLPDDYKPSK